MKIAFFRREINPEIGALVAGYSMTDHSVMIEDDLFMTGLLCDDMDRMYNNTFGLH